MDQEEQNQQQNSQCIYAQIGGDGKISDLIDQFYYKVLFDKTLRPFFYKADMSRVRLLQKIYFSCRMFGQQNQKYEGSLPRDIVELHRNLGVKHQHFDKFKKHLETILIDMEKPAELIKEIMAKVEEQRHFIVFEERSGDPKIVDQQPEEQIVDQ